MTAHLPCLPYDFNSTSGRAVLRRSDVGPDGTPATLGFQTGSRIVLAEPGELAAVVTVTDVVHVSEAHGEFWVVHTDYSRSNTLLTPTKTQYGFKIDCALNGCPTQHGDDGEVIHRAAYPPKTVNGHRVRGLQRTVTYSDWSEVPDGQY